MRRWFLVVALAGGGSMLGEVIPALAVDERGTLVTAWGPGTEIFVQRWRDGKAEELGKVGAGWAPTVAFDSAGGVLLGWQDRSIGNDETVYRRWDGKAWGAVENVSQTNTGSSRNPSLVVDRQGQPVLAWEEQYGSRADVWVRRREAKGWRDQGKHPGMYVFPQKMSTASGVSLALNSKGEPAVGWLDNAEGDWQVYFRRWSKAGWEPLQIVSTAKGGASGVSLALDGEGRPVLCWREAGRATVKRWNGSTWESLGEIAGEAVWPRMVMDKAGRPVVAMRTGHLVRVLRWTGKIWAPVGEVKWERPSEFYRDDRRQLALAAGGGKACVAWVENGTPLALKTACFSVAE